MIEASFAPSVSNMLNGVKGFAFVTSTVEDAQQIMAVKMADLGFTLTHWVPMMEQVGTKYSQEYGYDVALYSHDETGSRWTAPVDGFNGTVYLNPVDTSVMG
jgi:hypothetical protein